MLLKVICFGQANYIVGDQADTAVEVTDEVTGFVVRVVIGGGITVVSLHITVIKIMCLFSGGNGRPGVGYIPQTVGVRCIVVGEVVLIGTASQGRCGGFPLHGFNVAVAVVVQVAQCIIFTGCTGIGGGFSGG